MKPGEGNLGFFRKELTTKYRTEIPIGTSHHHALACLRSHDFILGLNHEMIEHNRTEGTPGADATYHCVDKKPVVGNTAYDLQIITQPNGCHTEVTGSIPLGLIKIWTQVHVVEIEGKWYIDEVCVMQAHRVLLALVTGVLQKTHEDQHAEVIEAAKKLTENDAINSKTSGAEVTETPLSLTASVV